jgi:hypothetical protein
MMRALKRCVLPPATHPVCCRLMDSTSSAMPSYSVTLYELEQSRSTQSVTAAGKARAPASEHCYKVCAVLSHASRSPVLGLYDDCTAWACFMACERKAILYAGLEVMQARTDGQRLLLLRRRRRRRRLYWCGLTCVASLSLQSCLSGLTGWRPRLTTSPTQESPIGAAGACALQLQHERSRAMLWNQARRVRIASRYRNVYRRSTGSNGHVHSPARPPL